MPLKTDRWINPRVEITRTLWCFHQSQVITLAPPHPFYFFLFFFLLILFFPFAVGYNLVTFQPRKLLDVASSKISMNQPFLFLLVSGMVTTRSNKCDWLSCSDVCPKENNPIYFVEYCRGCWPWLLTDHYVARANICPVWTAGSVRGMVRFHCPVSPHVTF